MAWEQLLVLVAFFVFPLVQNFVRKRAKARAERSSATEPPFDFGQSNSPPDWGLPELTPKTVWTKQAYARTPVAIPSPPVARRQPPRQPALGRPPMPESLPSPATIRATLRNRQGFRRAMVHKVVLGQPRALRRSN